MEIGDDARMLGCAVALALVVVFIGTIVISVIADYRAGPWLLGFMVLLVIVTLVYFDRDDPTFR